MHSLRSVVVIVMFLDNIPIFLIILIRRWKSDGFLKYIQKQVLELSQRISSQILKNNLHHILLSLSSTIDNPRIRNRNSFTLNLSLMTMTSSRMQAMRPSFSLYHQPALVVVDPFILGLDFTKLNPISSIIHLFFFTKVL